MSMEADQLREGVIVWTERLLLRLVRRFNDDPGREVDTLRPVSFTGSFVPCANRRPLLRRQWQTYAHLDFRLSWLRCNSAWKVLNLLALATDVALNATPTAWDTQPPIRRASKTTFSVGQAEVGCGLT